MSANIILAEALYGHFLFGSNVNSLACNNNIVKAIYIKFFNLRLKSPT
mgnify:CR=1 FL=1